MDPAVATTPDLLRLLAVPLFVWAARRDVETRRVPNRTWLAPLALAVALLAWDAHSALTADGLVRRLFLLRAGLSLGVVAPMGYLFWRIGAFGGADAKAVIVLALLFPTYPTYTLAGVTLPYATPALGVFSLSILSNAVVVGLAYPLALAVRNAAVGRCIPAMAVGRPIDWRSIPDAHGRLLETPSGFTRRGLDLDALRMYLRWRGATLDELRAAPARHRDPASLPSTPGRPGDGAVRPRSDGGERSAGSRGASGSAGNDTASGANDDDPWGAEAFLDDVGSAYGATPSDLRAALDLLAARERVWVSPGIPFLVPLTAGLLVGLVYGDLLFAVLRAAGLV